MQLAVVSVYVTFHSWEYDDGGGSISIRIINGKEVFKNMLNT